MGSCKLPLRSFFQLTTDVPASVHDPSNGYRVSIRVDRVENQIVFDTEEPHALAVPRLIPIQRIALWQALQRTGLSQELLRDPSLCPAQGVYTQYIRKSPANRAEPYWCKRSSYLPTIQSAHFSFDRLSGQDTPRGDIVHALLKLCVKLLLRQATCGDRNRTGEFHLKRNAPVHDDLFQKHPYRIGHRDSKLIQNHFSLFFRFRVYTGKDICGSGRSSRHKKHLAFHFFYQ